VQGNTTLSNQQATLLAFDLAGFAGPVQHAVLRLPVRSAGAGIENGLSLVLGPWNEATITWNTQPAAGNPFAAWTPKAGQTVEIAVTPIVQRLLAEGYSTLSLKISATRGSSAGLATYGPYQADPLLPQPELVLYGPVLAVDGGLVV
jgi:hypothetical protein